MTTTPTSTPRRAPDPNDFDRDELDLGRPRPGPQPTGETWAIDADTLRCIQQQEGNTIIFPGDEVYIASVAFRSTPGQAGSTSTRFNGGLTDIKNVQTGETHPIPDAMGRVTFGNVNRRSLQDIVEGRNPEIVGTLAFVWESDHTRKDPVNQLMRDVAAAVRPVMAGVIENLSFADLSNGQTLASTLAAGAVQLQQVVQPLVVQFIRQHALTSLLNPDDFIDTRLNAFVAVDGSLAGQVDQGLGNAVPSGVGVAGALRSRTYTQRFSGDGATYDVTYRVSE